ncbi:RHS repeat-associated core domain-containing protein [Marinicella sp. W31]|uniref:RHS repeat-associated core domain-containing protein n=1 Tax=Marinicella sp. W31 TaxID=3023713 RepID=UPI003756B325
MLFQVRYFHLIVALLLSLPMTVEAVKIDGGSLTAIQQEVFNGYGYYDAAEIEKRVRQWGIDEPMPRSSLNVLTTVLCERRCNPSVSLGNSSLPSPTGLAINGYNVSGDDYYPHLNIQFNQVDDVNTGRRINKVTHYLLNLAHGNEARIETFLIPVVDDNNTQANYQLMLQLRDLPVGEYFTQVRAVFQEGASDWTPATFFSVVEDLSRVGDLAPSELHKCLVMAGHSDREPLKDIEKLSCNGLVATVDLGSINLTDADGALLPKLYGLRQLTVYFMPQITSVAALNIDQLPHLSWLNVRGGSMSTAGLEASQSLDTVIFKTTTLTEIPALPPRASYIDMSESAVVAGATNLRGYPRKVVKLNDNPLVDVFFKHVLFGSSSGSVLADREYLNIEIFDIASTGITSISEFPSIQNLKHLNVNETNIGEGTSSDVDVSGFALGLCGLQMDDTTVTNIEGFKPIQFLSAKNNSALYRVKSMNNMAASGEPASFLLPNYVDLSGSEMLACGHLFNLYSRWDTYPHVDLTGVYTLECPDYSNADTFNKPVGCLPGVLKNLSVYQQEQQLLSWEMKANQHLWGVTHYEFEVLDSNGQVMQTFYQHDELATSVINHTKNPFAFRGRICKNTVCGDWDTVEQNEFQQPLVAVENLNSSWLNVGSNDLRFQLSVGYPENIFDTDFGKPDYFKISPINSTTQQAPPNITVGAQHQSAWLSAELNFNDYQVNDFEVSACRNDIGCGEVRVVNIGLPAEVALNPVAYEDENSGRRYLFWDRSTQEAEFGISYYEIESIEDPNCPVNSNSCNRTITQEFNVADTLPFIAFGVISDYYKVRACNVERHCSEWESVNQFQPGLARVNDLRNQWQQNGFNHEFKLKWDYSDEAFCVTGSNCSNSSGRPDFFKITPIFPQGTANTESSQVIVPVDSNNNYNTTISDGESYWSSEWIRQHYFLGNSYSVQACNADYCGAPAHIALGEPITSQDLPVPEWNFSPPTTIINFKKFDISWNSSVFDDEDVDYIEVRELQPQIHAEKLFYDFDLSANPPVNPSMDYSVLIYYVENKSELSLERVVKGNYFFNLRACKRDRESGDVCSGYSATKEVRLNREEDVQPLMPQQATSVLTPTEVPCSNGGTCLQNFMAAEWTYPFNPKVDYFTMYGNFAAGLCGAATITGPTSNTIVIDASNANIDPETGKWSTRFSCDYPMAPPGDQNFQIRACNYGTGCGPYQIVNLNPSNPDRVRDLEPLSATRNVVGGPGDMNPGMWWNQKLNGTGWHFYWASELRYPSVHENYGATYDLLGLWVTYKLKNDVWTPIWMYSQMKQKTEATPGCNPHSSGTSVCGFFEGDLLYVTRTSTGEIEQRSQGRLQVFFDSSGDNQRAMLNLDIDSDEGILTQDNDFSYNDNCDTECLSFASDGTLNMPITDFNIYLDEEAGAAGIPLNQAWGPKNDSDHYSGMWVNTDSHRDEFTLFTHVERDFEWSTLAFFDTTGHPIWAQGQTCYPCANPGPDAGYFVHDYNVVAEGFHPLHYRPNDFTFAGVNIFSIGQGGRRFDVGGFTEGEFWSNLNVSSAQLPGRGVGASLQVGSAGNPVDINKMASFHDIRYFINAHDETEDTCDPNTEGECVIYFTWFTDDDFPLIEPFYTNDGGLNYYPLSDICGNTPVGHVTRRFECTFNEPGTYRFQLHKPQYNSNGTEPMAESNDLTILPCTTQNCEGTNSGEPTAPPADPPAIVDMSGLIAPDPENDTVGSTMGGFDVDESGAASYSIPIFAPKGRGGLAPEMALNYHSMSGNGVAGVGFHISGTSAITRCLKSREHDGDQAYYPGISMSDDDAFCLDGMRLIEVGVEPNGSKLYKTELASFSYIRASGIRQGNGPKIFEVKTKNGDIRRYGSPGTNFQGRVIFTDGTGAQVRSTDGTETVQTWQLAEIKDRYDNRIRFAWDSKDGESYLIKVYWGNVIGGKHHYQINFNYSDSTRPDAVHGYGIGSEYGMFHNLESVSTLIREKRTDTQMQEVRHLKLDYRQNGAGEPVNFSSMLQLASVTQCVTDAGPCHEPLTFEWDINAIPNPILFAGNVLGRKLGAMNEMGFGAGKPIDINGDGVTEMIFVKGYDDGNILFEDLEAEYHIALHLEEGEEPPYERCSPVLTRGHFNRTCNIGVIPFDADERGLRNKFDAEKWFVLDYNGDGFDDVLTPIMRVTPGLPFPIIVQEENYFVLLSNGTKLCGSADDSGCGSFAPIDTGIKALEVISGSSFLDYTADGLPDLIHFSEVGDENEVYTLFPMKRATANSDYALSTADSEMIHLNTVGLNPTGFMCYENSRLVPCIYVGLDDDHVRTGLTVDKLHPTATDFNGDGYNDALLKYSYKFHPEVCGLSAEPAVQSKPNGKENQIPEGLDYSTKKIDDASTRNANSNCEFTFWAAMTFNPVGGDAGAPSFDYRGKVGMVRNTRHNIQGPSCAPFNNCSGYVLDEKNTFRALDINGDGLSDLVFLDSNHNWNYQLNTGQSDEEVQGLSTFDTVKFSSTASFNIPSDSNFTDREKDDRRYLVQFMDIDGDGDTDILHPAREEQFVGANLYYKYRRYDAIDPYSEEENSFVFARLIDKDPKYFVHQFFDLNADTHTDHFVIYRNPSDDNNNFQLTTYGRNPWRARDKITKITANSGEFTTDIKIHYDSSKLPQVYQKTSNSLNQVDDNIFSKGSPIFDVNPSTYLVRKVSKSAPIESNPNAMASMYYSYAGFRVQGGGRGSLGFERVTTYDPHHKVKTQTYYHQDYPLIGRAITTEASVFDHFITDDDRLLGCTGNTCVLTQPVNVCESPLEDCQNIIEGEFSEQLLSESVSYYETDVIEHTPTAYNLFPRPSTSWEKSYDLNDGQPVKAAVSSFEYFPYDLKHGNLSRTSTRSCKGNIDRLQEGASVDSVCGMSGQKMLDEKITINIFEDDEDNWLLGRLTTAAITSRRLVDGQYEIQPRSSRFEYDPVTGQIVEEIVGNESDPSSFLRTRYVYDEYGQNMETYQCSRSVSKADCDNKNTIIGRPYDINDPYYVHRYTRNVYDEDWDEYVQEEYQPFTTQINIFNQLTQVDDLENGTFDFVQQQPTELQTSYILLASNGKARDIYGNPYLTRGLYSDTVHTVYGAFGEAHAIAPSTGGMSKTTKRWCLSSNFSTYQCPSLAAMVTVTESSGAPIQRVYHDQLGREVRSQVQNMQGLWMTTDTYYDIMGRTVKQSEPYLRSNNSAVTSTHYTTSEYDTLDRVVKVTSPAHCVEDLDVEYVPGQTPSCVTDGVRVATTAYDGLTVATTNPNNQTTQQVFDESGKVVQSIDALGSVIEYSYDPHGNLITTTSYKNGTPNTAQAITIEMDYDLYGRKVEMRDPDKGQWTYNYNPLGELIKQTDAKGQISAMHYDVRGRMFYRHEPFAVGLWEYDLGMPGKLFMEISRGEFGASRLTDVNRRDRGLDKYYEHDVYGRPTRMISLLYDGVDAADLTEPSYNYYETRQTYDGFGRAYQSFDGTGDGVLVQYNDYGYQVVTRDAANGEGGQIYHEVLETDARGQVVHERHHGRFETMKSYDDATGFLQNIQTVSASGELVQDLNYAFDDIGNLIRRSDMSPTEIGIPVTQSETFRYDVLNRLKQEYHNYTNSPTATYVYDKTGNLTFKHGKTLQYNDSKPHAVSQSSGGIEGTNQYAYDANGNMYNRTGAKDLTIGYTAFDKPDYMLGHDSAGDQWENYIAYDANRSRYLRVDLKNGAQGTERTVTHYAGGAEFVYKDTGEIKAKRYIGNLVIHVDIQAGEAETNRNRWGYNYLLKDHIGSTHTVVNQQGLASAYMSFDAWGQRRKAALPDNNAVYSVYAMTSVWGTLGDSIESTTNRGFTGHEHFDQLGIIHMNGRIYDASIGRFLQADPIIQDPYSTQSLNRYSYVMNNPLSYTDPTGYARLRKGWWRAPLAIAITIATSGAASGTLFAGTSFGNLVVANKLLFATLAGAASGAITTGNLNGALKGAIFAAAANVIGHGFDGKGGISDPVGRAFVHSIASGVSAEVDGGKFGHGFASALLSELAYAEFGDFFNTAEVGRDIVTNAILQGTISKLTGGKFVNGAISASYRIAFNHHIGSSNNPKGKPGKFVCQGHCKWNSAEDAHKAAAKAYYSLSVSDQKEYGWHVYEHSDGTFTYTYPTIGTKTSVAHAARYVSKSGKYHYDSTGHTHLDHNQFSGQDIEYVTQRTKTANDDRTLYLAGPDSRLYRLSSSTAIRGSRFASGSRIHFVSKYTGADHLPLTKSEDLGGF